MTATSAEISAALDANDDEPYGRARSVRAEQLVELAVQAGDRPLTVRALQDQIQAHEYDGENDKMLVPFARVLAMWDENPADFNHDTTYTLHWHFKWASGGMVRQPKVPLTTIRRWTEEMSTRYRQAGFGSHAVHGVRHYVASHIGDVAAAQSAFDDWMTADRDRMSDCHACDRNGQGSWHQQRDRDAEALRTWEPILEGRLRCAEEPHRVLAKSLLSLGRLGRWDSARAHHLRGYRMARRNPSLRRTVGLHLEFAALTGNEAYGLEILADHASWLRPSQESMLERLSFLEATAVLLGRLVALGRSDLPVGTPGEPVPVAALRSTVEEEINGIGQLFDRRNGTSAVSDRSRARLAAQPLIDSLPLGTRSTSLGERSDHGTVKLSTVATADLDGLIAEAEGLALAHHPGADAAWERVAAAGSELPPRIVAQIAQSRALAAARSGPAEARAAFLDVADLFAAAGDEVRSTVNRARAGLAAVLGGAGERGDGGPGRDELVAATERIGSLRAAGSAADDQVLLVRMCVVRERLHHLINVHSGPDGDPDGWSALDAELDAMLTDAHAGGWRYREATIAMSAAQARLVRDDRAGARESLNRAVDAYLAAETPWETADPLALLAQLALGAGEPAEAEEYLRAAHGHAGPLLDAATEGQLAHLRAEAVWRQGGRDGDVINLALAAARFLDGPAAEHAAEARFLAAQAFQREGRPAEAVALLEVALPDLEKAGDELTVVRVKRLYGQCLDAMGEHRDAAKVLLAAASVAGSWPDQTAHAMLAHDAGGALENAGLLAEAERAYREAAELWRRVGAVVSGVRATRARAWLVAQLDADEAGWPAALALMAEATAEIDGYAPAGADDRPDAGDGDRPDDGEWAEVEYERAETRHQTGQLLLRWASRGEHPESTVDDGLAAAMAAAEEFERLGHLSRLGQCQLLAAEFEIDFLARYDAAEARIGDVRRAAAERGDDRLIEQCDEYLDWAAAERPGTA